MQKIISCKVTDEYVSGTGAVVGAVGSHDDAALELSFSDIWAGTTKRIVWFDALGQNPTLTVLTVDLLVPGEAEVYRVPIPGEAKTVAGDMMMSIRGVVIGEDGKEDKAVVSATGTFVVLDSVWDDDASESEDITPSQAEQLQTEVDSIKTDISRAVNGIDAIEETLATAQGYAESANESAEASEASNVSAGNYATVAQNAAGTAIAQANQAGTYAEDAEDSKNAAETAAQGAADSKAEAESAAQAAAGSADSASASAATATAQATAAEGSAAAASESASQAEEASAEAKSYASAAQTSAANASDSESAAQTAAQTAAADVQQALQGYATSAQASAQAAQTAQTAAEKARDEAQSIVGGDYATREEAQGYADEAETAANGYTDDKISALTAADVDAPTVNEMNTAISAAIGTAVTTFNGRNGAVLPQSGDYTADMVGAAPAYTYGTEDLTAGETPLETGKLHFVYE